MPPNGHALLSAIQKDSEPVQKITIIPRTMGALGYVMQVPEEEKYLNTKKELEAKLVMTLGGRAAEEIVFDTVTTGAANDIEQATKIARAMITQYGMSDKFGLMALADVQSRYLDGRAVLNCGDATATEIDHEVMVLLKNSYEEAKALLMQHREAMDRIAAYLIKKETITGKEFMRIFRRVEKVSRLETAEVINLPDNSAVNAETEASEDPESLNITSEDTGKDPEPLNIASEEIDLDPEGSDPEPEEIVIKPEESDTDAGI